MHELSIAEALIEQVREHRPANTVVERVNVVVGPLHAIEQDAMDLAWQVITAKTDCEGVPLHLTFLPYRWRCPECARQWTTEDPRSTCTCGHTQPQWQGGDELFIESIEVEDTATCHTAS